MSNRLQKGVNDLKTWCEQNNRTDILLEWDHEKNYPLTPEDVSAKTNTLYWWKDKLGHSWPMRANCRTVQNQKCPYCSGRKVLKGFNDFQTLHPELAKEWHQTKNTTLKPCDFTSKSHEMVWWLGKCGHEWPATIKSRTYNHGCPYCNNKLLLSGFNDLKTVKPELAEEWDYEKNGDLTPDKVFISSKEEVWWKCKHGHEWKTKISSRSNGCICPECSKLARLKPISLPKSIDKPKILIKQAVSGVNDLQTLYPELVLEWDFEKNGELKPNMVLTKSHHKVWWKGECGHSWQQAISERTLGRGCPQCSKEQRSSFPEQAILYYVKQLFPDVINNDRHLTIELDIYIPSLSCAIEYDGIAWHKNTLRDIRKNTICLSNGIKLIRIRELGLPYLSQCICIQRSDNKSDESLNKAIKSVLAILSKDSKINVNIRKDRAEIYSQYVISKKENSLLRLYPDIAEEWHPYKNKNLTPLMVTGRSGKTVWWTCRKCGFEWQTSIISRTSGHGCPVCAKEIYINKARETRLSKRKSLLELNPELAEEWHPYKNKDLTPDMFTTGSRQKVWWLGKCGHEWPAQITDRNYGSSCPYCSNEKVLKGLNDLATLNPELSNEWNYNKNTNLTPENASPYSNKKVWWIGKCGHEWPATIGSRTQGNGCPYCSGLKVLKGFNDLQTVNPELAEEWHPYKNKDLTPEMVTTGSNQKVWWLGKCGHEWPASIKDRKKGNGCPYCSGSKVLKGFNDFATKRPDLLKEWNYAKNVGIEPDNFSCGSMQKVWWTCKTCGNEWLASINKRNYGRGCPICSGMKHPSIRCVETGKVYKTASAAHKDTGADISSINKCCKGKQRTSGGYHWEYVT